MPPKTATAAAPQDAPTVTHPRRNTKFIHVRRFRKDDTHHSRKDAKSTPIRLSGSHRMPSERHTGQTIDEVLVHELVRGQLVSEDLVDNVFGSVVSTNLAKFVLNKLVGCGIVCPGSKIAAPPGKKRKVADAPQNSGPAAPTALASINNAFDIAQTRSCIRSEALKDHPENIIEETDWVWPKFPAKPIDEFLLVDFLNLVMEECLRVALPELPNRSQLFRFAAPTDKHHAFPMSYEIDGQDMRPDIVLLPVIAFGEKGDTNGTKCGTVHEEYLNFTAIRLPGESKSANGVDGLTQALRYMRGTKRAQPWLRYVMGLATADHKVSFIRGDPNGTECKDIDLHRSGGSLEFVQLLLGLGLSTDEELHMSSDVELAEVKVKVDARAITEASTLCLRTPSQAAHSSVFVSHASTSSRRAPPSSSSHRYHPSSNQDGGIQASSRVLRSTKKTSTSTSSHKRRHDQIDDSDLLVAQAASTLPSRGSEDSYLEVVRRARIPSRSHDQLDGSDPFVAPATSALPSEDSVNSSIEVTRLCRIPSKVYGYEVEGIVFNGCSIRGRNTLVYAVRKPRDGNTFSALKLSWQLARRGSIEKDIYDLIKGKVVNVLASDKSVTFSMTFVALLETNMRYRSVLYAPTEDSTLEKIRGFTKEQYDHIGLEERILRTSFIDLKRPVRFFWSIQDFVMGVRGALLGHQWLVTQGFLHRDVSENNIVLALRPTDPQRGYLIDFDMAVRYENKGDSPLDVGKGGLEKHLAKARERIENQKRRSKSKSANGKLAEGRTGTTPYMSLNVLTDGHVHGPADDVESFLWVLLLFIYSYKRPLNREVLQRADEREFTHVLSSGKPVHVVQWPPKLLEFSEGNYSTIEKAKRSMFTHFGEFLINATDELSTSKRWESLPLAQSYTLLLLQAFGQFTEWNDKAGEPVPGKATHDELLKVLDEWLSTHPTPITGYNECPFKDEQGNYLV
ncbi:hypothetical protein BV22DRAFT_1132296 [Leucogyrophana mollusca]|uniref:Uncharacterized protein n=1 Tax=Leucogyrophana mollusca TaxID=85980 RepID=A0ACB8B6T6_9AGAM|nr:hypothetical protein BV22DRAFT_1132296 [Leucogyrophana mollusca]